MRNKPFEEDWTKRVRTRIGVLAHLSTLLGLSLLAFAVESQGQSTNPVIWVTNTGDSGVGSLRDAVQKANTQTGPNSIRFALPWGSVILVRSNTLELTDTSGGTTVDGDTNGDGRPDIVLRGETNPAVIYGLGLGCASNVVHGLVLQNFHNGVGIFVRSDYPVGNRVYGCYMGTDLQGVSVAGTGNLYNGIWFGAGSRGCIIGGTNSLDGNVISGNGGLAIILNSSRDTVIVGNLIGCDASGKRLLGNKDAGLWTDSSSNLLLKNNTVAGCTRGFSIHNSTNVTISGNQLGFESSGTSRYGNRYEGIYTSGSKQILIGGGSRAQANVCIGNGTGIYIDGQSTGRVVGNEVRDNAGAGIAIVQTGTRITLSQNCTYRNGKPGIDLMNDGVTPNASGDGGVGPNALLHFPVLLPLTGATVGYARVRGTSGSCDFIEIFEAERCPGNGGAMRFLYTVQASSNGTFVADIPAFDGYITATATDAAGNTSEMSVNVPAIRQPPHCEPIPDQSVRQNAILYYPLLAWDDNVPAEQLAFSLLEAPSGLCLSSPTGILSWQTRTNEMPGSYRVSVRVANDGVPSLSVTQTFLVTVVDTPGAGLIEYVGPAEFRDTITYAITNCDVSAIKECYIDMASPWSWGEQHIIDQQLLPTDPSHLLDIYRRGETLRWYWATNCPLPGESRSATQVVRSVRSDVLPNKPILETWSYPSYASSSIEYQVYTMNESTMNLNDQRVAALGEVFRSKYRSPYERARAISGFVADAMTYEHPTPFPLTTIWMLENGRGDCAYYSFFFVSLCRAAGMPARNEKIDGHFRSEVLLPGVGWLPVEPQGEEQFNPFFCENAFGYMTKHPLRFAKSFYQTFTNAPGSDGAVAPDAGFGWGRAEGASGWTISSGYALTSVQSSGPSACFHGWLPFWETGLQFYVSFTDPQGIDATTITNQNIRIVGSNGTSYRPYGSWPQVMDGGRNVLAWFNFAAPGGAWDAADDGWYTFYLEPNQVANTSGVYVPGTKLYHLRLKYDPEIRVFDRYVVGGKSGQNTVNFRAHLGSLCTHPVSFSYATEDDTAKANVDYIPVSGRITLYPGTNDWTRSIAVVVKSNAVPQGNKTFHLRLYDAVGGTIVRDRADCLIVDNLGSSNRPPELSSVTLLSGAIQDVPFDIPFAALAAATDAADLDCDPVTFRIESITHGMLMKNGTVVLPGQTVVVPGDNLTWRSGTNECGTVDAFTIRAFDGRLFSWREAQVSVRVGQMKSAVLTGLEFQNGDLHLSVFAHPGFMYTLEGNANLANPGGWSSVASTNPPVNRFVFVCPKVAGRQMFYRVKCP